MVDIVLALAVAGAGFVVLAARSLPVAVRAFLGFGLAVAAGTMALRAWDVAATEALIDQRMSDYAAAVAAAEAGALLRLRVTPRARATRLEGGARQGRAAARGGAAGRRQGERGRGRVPRLGARRARSRHRRRARRAGQDKTVRVRGLAPAEVAARLAAAERAA